VIDERRRTADAQGIVVILPFRVVPVPMPDRAYLRLPDVGNDVDDFFRLTHRKNKVFVGGRMPVPVPVEEKTCVD